MPSDIADETGSTQAAAGARRTFSPHAIHLLRTAQVNVLSLSQMADQKASILMGATFVVFSLVVSRSLVGDPPWSLIILGVSAFASSLCAVAAVLPKTGSGRLPPRGGNRLFFGHFALMDEAEWTESLIEDMSADETMFRMMLHDIHQHGAVLYKTKYRVLALAYLLFVAGLFATVVAFAFEFFAAS